MKVIVVGGGIAGLGAAFELRRSGVDVVLVERAAEVGGRCRSFEWHGRWPHTGAEALRSSEPSLTQLRDELASRGAARVLDLKGWETVHGERIYFEGATLDPLSLKGLRSVPGGLFELARLGALVPSIMRQRRRHDPNDLASAAWADKHDGASWLRQRAPRLFDHLIEPFMQYSTLESGDYGLGWILFALGDLGWARRGWWGYEARGAGGITHELGRVLDQDPGCVLQLGTEVRQVDRNGEKMVVEVSRDGEVEHLTADGVILATPGSLVAHIAAGLLSEAHRDFFSSIEYSSHHIARYLVSEAVAELPAKALLPSIEGFRRVGKIACAPAVDGSRIVTVDIKGSYAQIVDDTNEDQALDDAWEEAVRALPGLGDVEVLDRVLSRNDIALCRRPVGFIRNLASFTHLPPITRVAFAGDYLLNSTVGCAHLTGVRAARSVIAQQD
jgi:oxygen-dependent protoporphyrinogen oxidase